MLFRAPDAASLSREILTQPRPRITRAVGLQDSRQQRVLLYIEETNVNMSIAEDFQVATLNQVATLPASSPQYPVLLGPGDKGWTPSEAPFPSAARIQREIDCVLQLELSGDLEEWVREYGRVGRRNTYLWKWCRQGVEVTTLPCVRPELRAFACDTKVLGVVLDVLLDDVADQQGDSAFLEHLLGIPFCDAKPDASRFSPQQQEYAAVTARVWNEIEKRTRSLPGFEQYADLWRFDYLQLLNVMRYSHLLNQDLSLLNLVEHDLYSPHNMHMMISSTVDLMCSPGFDHTELGLLREAVSHAQFMGRIGNLVTTWQREIGERDFSSGVFASAISKGDLTISDLLRGDRKRIEAGVSNGDHEGHFLAQWRSHRLALLSVAEMVRSVDLRQLVTGLERLVCLHLGSRGYK
jgi:hypothetical protein